MDASETIDRFHPRLRQLLAFLLVYVGLADNTHAALRATDNAARAAERCREPLILSRRVRDWVLQLLLPMEAATRRLIVVLASKLPKPILDTETPTPSPSPHERSTCEPGLVTQSGGISADSPPPFEERLDGASQAEERAPRSPLFSLEDPRKDFSWFWNPQPEAALPWAGPGAERADPYKRLYATNLLRRVAALTHALDDLPAQARRMLRWQAARLKARQAGKFVFVTPLRGGTPPGAPAYRTPLSRQREEHWLLADLHERALYAQRYPDTS